MRYIEVVANIRVEREVEGYEVALELSTSAGRRVACFNQALELREAIVGLLKKSGLTDSEIREGGAEATQSYWSSRRSIIHRIAIRNKSMDVLMSAMAATEQHFAGLPRSLFGRTRQDFTFHTPVPFFAPNASADGALRNAIQNARKTAEVIANEFGFRLGQLISVVEHYSERPPKATTGFVHDHPDDAGVDFCESVDDSIGSLSYTALRINTSNAARRFHIRFATEDAGQIGERESPMTPISES